MNIEQLNQQVIINEWQLGQQLNTAVHNGTRDKFNLLLSFLSDDARDFAQFDVKEKNEDANGDVDLRAHFDLSETQPLVNEGPSDTLLAELNQDLQQHRLHDIRFKQLLTNEAILSRKEQGALPQDVLDNLPLIKQQRVNAAYHSTLKASEENISMEGVDAKLIDEYNRLDIKNRPVQLQYSYTNSDK